MNRILTGCGLLLTVGVALVLSGFGQDKHARDLRTDEDISEMVSRIDPAQILSTASALQGTFTHQSCSDQPQPGQGVTTAREIIFTKYSAIPGLQVVRDPFVHPNCPNAPTFNVIAWLPGARHPERLVIVGGHYDSRTINVFDSTSFAPAGNDAGAQTGVVLEVARVLARHRYDATLVFMSFSGEEQGLFGSASIAANLTRYFPNPQVVAMINTDIPGGNNTVNFGDDLQRYRLYSPGIPREQFTTDPDGTTDNTSPSRGLMRYVAIWGGAYVPSMAPVVELRQDRPGRGSDHISFINQGFAAVRLMETKECSPSPPDNSCGLLPLPCPTPANIPANCKSFLTAHQHTPFDLTEHITPSYASRITQVIAASAASLASAPDSPVNFSAVGDAVNGVRVSFNRSRGGGEVDHFVVAARPVTENFYRRRVRLEDDDADRVIRPERLGITPGDAFFISVASVDENGHESLFAFPEVRCDSTGCVVPPGMASATVPVKASERVFKDVDDE
jgi:Peptidase family M28